MTCQRYAPRIAGAIPPALTCEHRPRRTFSIVSSGRSIQRRASVRTLDLFPSELGWMALQTKDGEVERLTFGHASAAAAERAFNGTLVKRGEGGQGNVLLAGRLQAYAAGFADDFRDVAVTIDALSAFQRRVLEECRRIPRGQTISYGELAVRAGFPRASRAVGTCLARNPLPLIIPCHRVVLSCGNLGLYSACGGPSMKRRLLQLELADLA